MMKALLMVLLVSTAAFAQPSAKPTRPPEDMVKLTHDKARRLMLALKLAGVDSVKAKNKWTWTVQKMSCPLSLDAGDDRLGTYQCQVDRKKLTGAAAYALFQGLTDVGIQSDSGGGFELTSLTCVDDLSAADHPEGTYTCTVKRPPAPLD
jgi:hypothetical protein